MGGQGVHIHAGRASRHPPPLLQAFELPPAARLGLALHVVIVEVAAPGADEERGGQERGGRGADLLDGRDRVREGRGVDEDVLVEPAGWALRVSRGLLRAIWGEELLVGVARGQLAAEGKRKA